MSKLLNIWTGIGATAVAFALTVGHADRATSQDAPKKEIPAANPKLERREFMRKKLTAAEQILEGLTMENAALMTQGARQLVDMTSSDQWKVKDDLVFRQLSSDFQRSATALRDSAGDFDSAATKWMETTKKCLDCHKHLRSIRLANNEAQ